MYTPEAKLQQNLLSPTELQVFLLEIAHAALSEAVRIVVDNAPINHLGKQYMPVAARLTLPKDEQNQVASANLSIDNVSRTLTKIVEETGGLRGVTVNVKMIYRERPDIVELEHEFDWLDISLSPRLLSGTLSYNKIMDLPATPMSYRPSTKPGLF